MITITLDPRVAIELEAIAVQVGNQEFSGFGFVEMRPEGPYVYDYVLLDVGSSGYTEISVEDSLKLMERPDPSAMKLWIHRHPVGNGNPGLWNWSGTDNQTIAETPLGGIPQLVKWSASIVRTPGGWVGRVDNYLTGKTVHCAVLGQAPKTVYDNAERLLGEYLRSRAQFRIAKEPEDRQAEIYAFAEANGLDPADLEWVEDYDLDELYDLGLDRLPDGGVAFPGYTGEDKAGAPTGSAVGPVRETQTSFWQAGERTHKKRWWER